MVKKIVGLALCLLSLPGFAEIKATLDRDNIGLGESFQLTIRGVQDGAELKNFNDLKQNFDVLSSGQSSQIIVSNGKTYTDSIFEFVLSPKKAGEITLPSLVFGSEKSPALQIHVDNNSAAQINENSQVFIKTQLNPASPYVQSQALYTVKIFYNTRIQNPKLSEPHAGQATFMHLGNDKNYEANIKGKTYEVMELHFAFFPQKSGKLMIEPPVLSGNIIQSSSGQYFSNLWEPITISANKLEVSVLAIPAITNANWWLPAKKITVKETWSQEGEQLNEGEPITRTLIIQGEDVLANQLPKLMPEKVEGFQIYAEKPILKNRTDGQGLYSTRIEKAAFIANRSGKLSIPPIHLYWWDTANQTQQEININAKHFAAEALAQSSIQKSQSGPRFDKITNALPLKSFSSQRIWLWTTLVFGFLWLITFLLLLTKKVKKTQAKTPCKEPKTHALKKALQKAAAQNDAAGFSTQLIQSMQILYPEKSFFSLGDVESFLNNEAAQTVLQDLEKKLYHQDNSAWQGKKAWQVLEPLLLKKTDKSKKEDLPAFFKTSG